MIDTHTHLNFKAFENDWQEVVERAVETGVEKMIVVGTDLDNSKRAVEMAKENQTLYASIGIHPHHVRGIINNKLSIKNLGKELTLLIKRQKVVAVGEAGLDYHYYKNSKYKFINSKEDFIKVKNLQLKLFKMQIELARQFDKPLIIHSREASDDVLETVVNISKKLNWKPKGVFHCFEGSKKYLKKILEAGFYISFTGNITYSRDRAIVSKEVPFNRLLLETDSPLISPYNLRGERNTPENVKIIAEKHADIRSLQYNEVAGQTTTNARMLFHI